MFIVYLTGLLMTCYLILATGLGYFTHSQEFQIEEYYWPILLFLAFIFFLFDIKILKSFSNFKIRKYLDIIAVFFILLITRLWFVNEASVWLDEHIQALYSTTLLPVAAGAIQHQPPGDMVLTHLGLWVSGYSVLGLRFHACLFSALAGATLFGLTRYFSGSRVFGLLCMFFFSIHHIIFKNGYLARPVSFGLFMELLFFSALFLQIKQISEKRPAQNNLYLSGITVIYLSSLGFQPPFIVGLSVLFFAILSYFKREYLKTTGLILIGLAVFIPLQIFIINLSPPRFTLTTGLNLSRTFEELKYVNFEVLRIYVNPIGYICMALLFLYVVMLFYKSKSADFNTAFIFFLTLLFPLIAIPYFKAHVAWELLDHYLVSILPLLFLFFSVLWGHLLISKQKWPWISSLLSICIFVLVAKTYVYKDRYGLLVNEHQDLKSAYKTVRENMGQDDLVLSFCLNSENFCAQWLIGKPFYFKENPIDLAKTSSVEVYRKALAAGTIGKNIFFLYQNEWSALDPGAKNRVGKFNKVMVYKVPTDSNPAKAVIDFFSPYVESGLAEHKLYPEALAYLIASYDYLGNDKEKTKLLSIFKNEKSQSTPENWYLDKLTQ